MRVLVGGVGYRNLRDHSVGVVVADRFADREWPDGVVVEDVSYNPIALVQRLDSDPLEMRFDRAVIVAGVSRVGRFPGVVTAYRWDGVLPAPDEIHRAVCDAVTGVIFIDNTLVVARHFGALPDEVAIVEVEPFLHEFGDAFSDPVAGVFDRVCALVASLATDEDAALALPEAPLGGPARVETGAR